jgi:hypothetical protein
MATELAELDAMLPGAELASMLNAAAPSCVDDDGVLLDAIAGWDRIISWAHAKQAAAIAEFARRPWSPGLSVDEARAKYGKLGSATREFVDDEIAARLCVSSSSAGFKLDLAVYLADPFTATAAALETGAIDVQKARVIVECCRRLDPETAVEVEKQALLRASDQTTARLKQTVRRLAIAADPVEAQLRCTKAKLERGVWLNPLDDGMAEISAILEAAEAVNIYNVLTATAVAAKKVGEEPRTMAQLRADFLTAPFIDAVETGKLAGARPGRLATHRGNRGQLQLTVPASVLFGFSDAPGELVGYGPITAEVAREIAGDCTWRRVITDPVDGTMIAVDTDAYRPPAALVRHVETRDGICRFRGCARPSTRCQLDHSVAHPIGRTCHDNLGAFCEHHHRFKHALDGAYSHLKQPKPGVFVWTMPTGHTYTVTPPALAPPHEELQRPTPPSTDDDPPPF